LGLAIAKGIIAAHSGDIWVESEEKVGSKFYFSLPHNIAKEHIIEKEIVIPKSIPTIDWSDKTILIVEDEDSNFRFLNAVLQKTKAKIIWARNGNEAVVEINNNNNIDIILMDIKMPIMNGIEATKIIRTLRGTTLPIIAQTAFAISGEKEKCFEAGCSDYMSKPIKPKDLLETLRKNMKYN